MNSQDVLNKLLYPTGANVNVRRKSYPLYDQVSIATGTTNYLFFTTTPGNYFQRNTRLPLAGTEVFFIKSISAYLEKNIATTALCDGLNELLQQSYLQISVDNRIQCKIPGLDFIQYMIPDSWSDQVVVTQLQPRFTPIRRKLPIPIVLNSTSSFEFRFVIPSTAATTFNGVTLHLELNGYQFDKIQPFVWDNLKNNQWQSVPVTYYNTVAISSAAAATNSLFVSGAENLISQTFPLSEIVRASIQNIEVYFNQPDTPIEPTTIFNSRINNVLTIHIDDVDYYKANIMDMISVVAGFGQTLTTTPDLDVVTFMNIRQSKTLPVPINIPAQGKVNITLEQPASSLGITGEFTVVLRGTEMRRVA